MNRLHPSGPVPTPAATSYLWHWLAVWRSGSVIHHMNKVNLCWVRFVLRYEWQSSIRADKPSRNVTLLTRPPQPCILPGSPNQVPALIGWGKSGNVTHQMAVNTVWSHYDVLSHTVVTDVYELLYSLYSTLLYLPVKVWLKTASSVNHGKNHKQKFSQFVGYESSLH